LVTDLTGMSESTVQFTLQNGGKETMMMRM
jgi:hypothetical protein